MLFCTNKILRFQNGILNTENRKDRSQNIKNHGPDPRPGSFAADFKLYTQYQIQQPCKKYKIIPWIMRSNQHGGCNRDQNNKGVQLFPV